MHRESDSQCLDWLQISVTQPWYGIGATCYVGTEGEWMAGSLVGLLFVNWAGICFASHFTPVSYLSKQWVINVVIACVRSAGLMIILCRARKIKPMTYAKVKGNTFSEKTRSIIRTVGFHIIKVNVNKIFKIIFLEHGCLENFRARMITEME